MIGRTFRELAIVLALALIPAAVSLKSQVKLTGQEALLADEVRLETTQIWGDNVLWVDVRDVGKYERSHIPGAVRLNSSDWDTLVAPFLDAWDPAKSTVLYGDAASDDDAHEIAERLRTELQLERIFVLKGGWETWRKK